MLLHHAEELDNNLRARADEDLTLPSLLGVVDGIERIVKDGCFDHFGGLCGFGVARFSDRFDMRYL